MGSHAAALGYQSAKLSAASKAWRKGQIIVRILASRLMQLAPRGCLVGLKKLEPLRPKTIGVSCVDPPKP